MMQPAHASVTKNLVLIGGGHSHAIALKLLGMNPLAGVRLTLISDTSHTPYSGMLPGHVAGFYSFAETHIDLQGLARFAQAQFYLDSALGLDLVYNKVICASHSPITFDYLSLDIGSTPDTANVPGAREYAILAKPVSQFLTAWNQMLETVTNYPEKNLKIAIVGGGAGGVELALNMQSRLHILLKKAQQNPSNLSFHLFHRGPRLLPNHNAWTGRRLYNILQERGVELHLGESVRKIVPIPGTSSDYQIICESGLVVNCDRIIWVTQASAPSWLKASGLATDSRGFVLVKDTLQSVSHPHIFATGDIATMEHYPRPKAGVFAVGQGQPLFENLQRILLGKTLKPYFPQKQYLSLIGTGDRSAIASRSWFRCESPLMWRWKDHIDRQFMRRFKDLNRIKGF